MKIILEIEHNGDIGDKPAFIADVQSTLNSWFPYANSFFSIKEYEVPFAKEIEAINKHQNCSMVHPLTCGKDSRHEVLRPELSLVLKCPTCDYVQTHIPPYAADPLPPNPFYDALQKLANHQDEAKKKAKKEHLPRQSYESELVYDFRCADRLWIEDDATLHDPSRETLKAAFLRLTGQDLDSLPHLGMEDRGDHTLARYPNGYIVCRTYPGENEIRQIKKG